MSIYLTIFCASTLVIYFCVVISFLNLETKEPLSLKAHQLKQAFFNSSTLTAICKRLVTHYFLLTPRDLELWDTDPESFGKYFTIENFK